jgi:hypothetical protein
LKADLDQAIIGQGSVVFFNSRSLLKTPDGTIVAAGPELEYYSINSRPTLEATVKKFYRETDEGKRIEPFIQKHLVAIITTRKVVDSTKLGKFGTSDFPLVEFTGEEGRYALGNGHHRHQVTRLIYKGMIEKYEKALQVVSQPGTRAANAEKTKAARLDLEQSAMYLYTNARWGVVLYDEGNTLMCHTSSCYTDCTYVNEAVIQAHASPRILYRMIASNEVEFNKPDDEDDVFALAVRAMHGATVDEAKDLIHNILAQKPGGTKSTLSTVLSNEDEMHMYSNLLVFPMFKSNRFISFWKLYQQKQFAQSVCHEYHM